MKRNYSVLVLTIIFAFAASSQSILRKTLPNGMEVVVKENKSSPSVGVYCYVKTGSNDEGKYLGKGLSHYLEHLVCAGSTKNHNEEWHLNKRKEIGAIFNAATSWIYTVYYMQADKKYADDCLYLTADNVMNYIFDPAEVAREKDVIVKEFVYRVATPLAQAYNKMRERTFPNSNCRHEIIGNIDVFKTVTRDELIDYYNKRYMPNNMIFVVVGDLDTKEMMGKIEETFKDYKRGVLEPVYQPQEKIRRGNLKYVDEFDIQQTLGFVTKLIPPSAAEDFAAIGMACQILFEKRSSPVQYKLVEQEKLVNWVYGYFNDGGFFPESIQFEFEPKETGNSEKVINRIDEIINEVAEKGITQKQIDEVIKRSRTYKLMRNPDIDSDANNIGWNMMEYNIPDMFETYMAQYEALTPEKVTQVIRKYFTPNNRVIYLAVPEGRKQLLISKDAEIEISDAEKTVINENITLIHKQNTTAPVIQGEIFLPISTDYEKQENAGTFQFMIDNVFDAGTKDYTSMEISSWIEDHCADFFARVDENGLYVSFKCVKDDLNELLKIFYSIMNKPVFDEQELKLAKERKDSYYKSTLELPEFTYKEFLASILYKGQKSAVTEKEKNDIIQNISRNDLKDTYKKYFKAEKVIAALFGDLTKNEAVKYAKEIRNNTPLGKIEGDRHPLIVPKLNGTYVNECEFEQVNVVLNYQAPVQSDPDYFAMKALDMIMSSGFSGRLLKATRFTSDLAWHSYSIYSAAEDYGSYKIEALTTIANKDELVKVLKHEVQKLIDGDVTQEEIDLSIESYERKLVSYTDEDLLNKMSYYESAGLGYNFLKESLKDLKKVTPEDIKAVANKYLKDAAVIISQPSKDVKRVVE